MPLPKVFLAFILLHIWNTLYRKFLAMPVVECKGGAICASKLHEENWNFVQFFFLFWIIIIIINIYFSWRPFVKETTPKNKKVKKKICTFKNSLSTKCRHLVLYLQYYQPDPVSGVTIVPATTCGADCSIYWVPNNRTFIINNLYIIIKLPLLFKINVVKNANRWVISIVSIYLPFSVVR